MADDRSNERADVARRILELSETIEEALIYMLAKLEAPDNSDNASADMLKDVGEGMISLESAASAIAGPMGAGPEDISRLSQEYDLLTERMDALIDAYVEDRASDFPILGRLLRETFETYGNSLAQCFRGIAVM